MSAMLSVRDLAKTYAPGKSQPAAVAGVSLEIAEGNFHTLLGPSGCGKTTTLRCIAGLERPDFGTISIGGETVSDAKRGIHVPTHKRSIGMVFQSYAIWPHLDVLGNVAFPLLVCRNRPPRSVIRSRVGETLALVGMEGFERRPATDLSGGQQQRVALARALVREPKLLLLDEPLSNLDAKLRERMRDELRELVSRVGVTTLYVTHDQTEALAMSDRIAVMAAGRIVQEDAPRPIYLSPADPFVASFLGAANIIPARLARNAHGVELPDGACLPLDLPPGLASQQPGRPVRLIFRPEDTRLDRARPQRGVSLVGRVERSSFLGSRVEYRIRVFDTILRAYTDPSEVIPEGTPVWLTIAQRRALVFPEDSSS
ncbi:MAG TPA: ABC transporter ATP-binding protein [Xanthobacteraceae bacterium]